jgi:hypothetical protein
MAAWYSTFKIHYAPQVIDRAKRHGQTTRMWQSKSMQLDGTRMEIEMKRYHNRGAQVSNNLMAPQPAHKPGKFDRLRIHFDHTDPTNNDFLLVQGGLTTTFYDMLKLKDSMFKPGSNGITKDMDELVDDVGETIKKLPHLPSDGRFGVIATGGKVNDDHNVFASMTAYTSGSTHCALKLTAGSIALIGEGENLEIRNSSGVLLANNVKVERVFPYEKVLNISLTSDSANQAGALVTTLDALAATDVLYKNGCYNQSVKGSLSHLFTISETWFRDENGNAIDRLSTLHKQLLPHTIQADTSETDLNENHLRAVGETVAHTVADGNAEVSRMVVMARDGYNGLTRLQRDERIRLIPALESEVGRKLNLAYGFNGYVFHDPNLGTLAAVVDDFAQYGRMRFLDRNDWALVSPTGVGDFQFLPGGTVGNIWFVLPESDGTQTPSFRYAARGFAVVCQICDFPANQVELTNLNTAA